MAEKPVGFTQAAAGRIVRAVRTVEGGGVNLSPVKFRTAHDDGDPVRLGKTTSAWDKNTLATITLYDDGEPLMELPSGPPNTLEECVNKFADIGANKWVMLARASNGSWYVISAEC